MIISRTGRCQNPAFETVNILACQSQRATCLPSELETLLDIEDGMDWATLVRCDFLWTAPKAELTRKCGSVTPGRRRAIGATMIRVLGLWLA